MNISKKYRQSFWKGFLYAVMVSLYCLFISFIWLSIAPTLGEVMPPIVYMVVFLFMLLLSVVVVAYIVFFEPFKLIINHHVKTAGVLIGSTLGWLFIFLLIFIIGFLITFYA